MVTDTCIVAGEDIITAGAEDADIITAGGTTVRWNQLSSNIARAKQLDLSSDNWGNHNQSQKTCCSKEKT